MPKTISWEVVMSRAAHEHYCQRWPHKLHKKLLVNRTSRWNRWVRTIAKKLCPITEGEYVEEYRAYLKQRAIEENWFEGIDYD